MPQQGLSPQQRAQDIRKLILSGELDPATLQQPGALESMLGIQPQSGLDRIETGPATGEVRAKRLVETEDPTPSASRRADGEVLRSLSQQSAPTSEVMSRNPGLGADRAPVGEVMRRHPGPQRTPNRAPLPEVMQRHPGTTGLTHNQIMGRLTDIDKDLPYAPIPGALTSTRALSGGGEVDPKSSLRTYDPTLFPGFRRASYPDDSGPAGQNLLGDWLGSDPFRLEEPPTGPYRAPKDGYVPIPGAITSTRALSGGGGGGGTGDPVVATVPPEDISSKSDTRRVSQQGIVQPASKVDPKVPSAISIMGSSPLGGGPTVGAAAAVTPTAAAAPGGGPWYRNQDILKAIMQAGLATMAGKSSDAMTNIGQGGLAGMEAYSKGQAAKKKDARALAADKRAEDQSRREDKRLTLEEKKLANAEKAAEQKMKSDAARLRFDRKKYLTGLKYKDKSYASRLAVDELVTKYNYPRLVAEQVVRKWTPNLEEPGIGMGLPGYTPRPDPSALVEF